MIVPNHVPEPELVARPGIGRRVGTDAARLIVLLLPALAVILLSPGFMTQDGPSHVYNSEILRQALLERPDFRLEAFEPRLQPVPNWAGHAALVALLSVLPPRGADLALIVLTLVGSAVLCLWIVRVTTGRQADWPTLFLCALIATNLPWLFGFYSFILGALVGLATLGLFWRMRARAGPWLGAVLGGLLIAGYFCHPISLGLTIVSLLVLAATAGRAGRVRRLAWTGLGLTPMVPLALVYRSLMAGGGRPEPSWVGFARGVNFGSVLERLLWIDPLTLGKRTAAPFSTLESRWCGLVAPVFWVALGVLLLLCAIWSARSRSDTASSRPWFWVSTTLLLLGLAAPDSMGPTHGHYVTQRVTWFGLVTLVPALAASASTPHGKRLRQIATACLAVAWLAQNAFLADYGRESSRVFLAFERARNEVGTRQRVAGLFVDVKGRFRVNPLLHADCWLGVGNQNIVWSNYEAAYYYFPVGLRPGVASPPIREFEAISVLDRPEEAAERVRRWESLLEAHHSELDALAIWGSRPAIEAVTARWYEASPPEGMLGLWRFQTARPAPNQESSNRAE